MFVVLTSHILYAYINQVFLSGDGDLDKILTEIGDRLREFRKSKGLSQAKLADMLDISCNFYGSIERGKARLSIEKMIFLYKNLGLDLTYLLTGEESPKVGFYDIISDCPKSKIFDMEQIVRYASNLYKKDTEE